MHAAGYSMHGQHARSMHAACMQHARSMHAACTQQASKHGAGQHAWLGLGLGLGLGRARSDSEGGVRVAKGEGHETAGGGQGAPSPPEPLYMPTRTAGTEGWGCGRAGRLQVGREERGVASRRLHVGREEGGLHRAGSLGAPLQPAVLALPKARVAHGVAQRP